MKRNRVSLAEAVRGAGAGHGAAKQPLWGMKATFLDVFCSSPRKDTSTENSAFGALRIRTRSRRNICILSLAVKEELQI